MLKNNLRGVIKFTRMFTEIIHKQPDQPNFNSIDVLSEATRQHFNLTQKEYLDNKNLGVDIFLSPEKVETIKTNNFFFKDNNGGLDLNKASDNGWKLKYLKNMNLLEEYNTLFRDYLQSCALFQPKGLKLTCEERFYDAVTKNLNELKLLGYQLEIDTLTTRQEYSLLRLEVYKNLKINRYENKNYSHYTFSKNASPIGDITVANHLNEDLSIANNQKPFILAATMRVRSPMKIAIYNQNMTRKIYGDDAEKTIDYVVRFETMMNFSDFTWILPNPNKPSRLRLTKITDFNNMLRGNPYFFKNTWDLVDENRRYNYMTKDSKADEWAYYFLKSFKSL
jgi:hypothetical protein